MEKGAYESARAELNKGDSFIREAMKAKTERDQMVYLGDANSHYHLAAVNAKRLPPEVKDSIHKRAAEGFTRAYDQLSRKGASDQTLEYAKYHKEHYERRAAESGIEHRAEVAAAIIALVLGIAFISTSMTGAVVGATENITFGAITFIIVIIAAVLLMRRKR